jgi:hypothetical protein
MVQKSGDRRFANFDRLRQSDPEFRQGDVRLLLDQPPNHILMRRQRKILMSSKFTGGDAARFSVQLEEADDRPNTDAALLGGLRNRSAALD